MLELMQGTVVDSSLVERMNFLFGTGFCEPASSTKVQYYVPHFPQKQLSSQKEIISTSSVLLELLVVEHSLQ